MVATRRSAGYRRFAAYRYAKVVSRIAARAPALPARWLFHRAADNAKFPPFFDAARLFPVGWPAYGESCCSGVYFGTRGVYDL